MKIILKNALVIFLSIFLFSCINDENNDDTIPARKIANTSLHKIANYQNSILLKGKFKYFKNSDNQIVFYTETIDQKHIFFTKGNETLNFDKEINQITYLKDGILINNEIFIGVAGNVSDQLTKDIGVLSKNSIKESISASSLTHIWIPKENTKYKELIYSSPTLEKQVYELVNLDDVHTGKCDHGGVGSTSCSVGPSGGDPGCSVSCGSGYYACCVKGTTFTVTQSCHCHKN